MGSKVGALEEDFRELFTSWIIKDLTGMVEEFYRKKRLFLGFKYGFEKELISNQLTIVTVERIPYTNQASHGWVNRSDIIALEY